MIYPLLEFLNTFSNNILELKFHHNQSLWKKQLSINVGYKKKSYHDYFSSITCHKINQLLNELIIATLPINSLLSSMYILQVLQTVCGYCICISNEFYEDFINYMKIRLNHQIVIRNHLN